LVAGVLQTKVVIPADLPSGSLGTAARSDSGWGDWSSLTAFAGMLGKVASGGPSWMRSGKQVLSKASLHAV